MRKRKPPKIMPSGYLEQKPLRGPDEPTEYELAAARLDDAALRAWVERNYRSKYVPEEVLRTYGLRDSW